MMQNTKTNTFGSCELSKCVLMVENHGVHGCSALKVFTGRPDRFYLLYRPCACLDQWRRQKPTTPKIFCLASRTARPCSCGEISTSGLCAPVSLLSLCLVACLGLGWVDSQRRSRTRAAQRAVRPLARRPDRARPATASAQHVRWVYSSRRK